MAVMDMLDRELKEQQECSPGGGNPSPAQQQQPVAGLPAKPPASSTTDLSSARMEPGGQDNTGQARFRQMLQGIATQAQTKIDAMNKPVRAEIHGQRSAGPVQTAGSNRTSRVINTAVIPHRPAAQVLGSIVPKREDHPRAQGEDERSRGRHEVIVPSPCAVLSAECQRRKFNPVFREFMTHDGRFSCVVEIKGMRIIDKRTWNDARQAKQEAAKMALLYLEDHVPIESSTTTSRGFSSDSSHQEDRHREDRRRENEKRSHQLREEEELEAALLLAKIRRIYGRQDSMRSEIMADPIASRAFLEGFAWGARAANESVGERTRSRSPLRVANERRRSRSPPRGRDERRRRG